MQNADAKTRTRLESKSGGQRKSLPLKRVIELRGKVSSGKSMYMKRTNKAITEKVGEESREWKEERRRGNGRERDLAVIAADTPDESRGCAASSSFRLDDLEFVCLVHVSTTSRNADNGAGSQGCLAVRGGGRRLLEILHALVAHRR